MTSKSWKVDVEELGESDKGKERREEGRGEKWEHGKEKGPGLRADFFHI